MVNLKHFLTAALFLLFVPVFAQKQTVRGKVTDKSGNPLEDVSVLIKSTRTGTATDKDGNFSIEAAATDVLVFSIVGYKTLEERVGTNTSMNISLESGSTDLGEVVLVGTRRLGRVKTETPVPVDVVNIGQAALPTARMDVTSILNYAAPSFNYNKQSGSDGADHIDLATLRGLGPDQTLVLINGKRRHQTAFIAVFGTRGRGNSGTDLSAIPVGAIDRVEVLRDGASAQYGSDAIAGVINIVLKETVNKFNANIGYSGYYDKKYNPHFKKEQNLYVHDGAVDGNTFSVNANYGFKVGERGFINLTGNFLSQGKTYRQALETDQNSPDFMYTNIYRRGHGDGSLTAGGAFLNAEIPIAGKTSFYAFGGYNGKKSDAYAFTRNWSARPERFPTDNNWKLIFVPSVMKVTADDTTFSPHIQTNVNDFSMAAGVRGISNGGLNWDISNTIGRNNFHFYGDKTFNASLGSNQTHFDDGGFNFLQNTVNANFSKELNAKTNLAFGAEYRYERYSLYAGEEASYKNFSPNKFFTDSNGDDIYVAGGAQGFPGYQAADEVTANRSVIGAYGDMEFDITRNFLVTIAARFENYSDFGFTHNYKVATRLKLAPTFNLRGSFSTGFRAPSLQQINFSSTFTTVQGGNIAEVKIAPNYSELAKLAGIPDLTQEKSTNVSLGFTWKPVSDFSITIDGYMVKVKDRVVLSGQFDAFDSNLDPALAARLQSLNVSYAQFFANAVNTTNKGIDVVMDYNKRWGSQSFRALFTGNFQEMTIDKINVPAKLSGSDFLKSTFLNDREQKFILASAPKTKFGFNFEYGCKSLTVGTRLTYFGKIDLLGYGEDGLGIKPQVPTDANSSIYVDDRYIYNGKLVTDLYLGYKINSKISLFGGIDNLLNVHPDLGVAPGAKGWAFNNETGGPWDAVQMGGNGLRFFLRLGLQL
ncbi:TonB-dependent receptor [Lacibacter sp. H375]|uniref:TonB-dependent receptor n=1 Tax=Lacibacter sp. H375 TaxID=3133424 RepID=UPI0030BECFE9